MSIREKYKIDDIQKCIYALILKLTTATSPFTDWAVVYGFPEAEIFDSFTKPFIYVEMPVATFRFDMQAGGKPNYAWEMIIGIWDDRKTGGSEEISIMASQLLALFNDPQTCMRTQFNVTLGTTTYTNTTLLAQGIGIVNISGPREILDNVAMKEFRQEFNLTLET